MTTAISCAGVDYLDVDYLAEALEVCARSQLITNLLSRAGKRNQAVVLFWRLISAKHSDEYMTSYLQRPDKSHPTCHQFSGPDPALLSVATWICSCNRRQTGRSQHRLFVEFSVLIGQSGQGYQKNAFFFFFPSQALRDSDYGWTAELFNTHFDKTYHWQQLWLRGWGISTSSDSSVTAAGEQLHTVIPD